MPRRDGAGDEAQGAPVLEDDPRVPRGVIFERPYAADYSARYRAMLEDRKRGP
jgi:hypothetical protein